MGHLNTDSNATAINTILLVAKKHIFTAAFKKTTPNIVSYRKALNKVYAEQELVAKLSNKQEQFNKHWLRFRLLME